MIYLVGGEGFVGSAYARLFDRLELDYRVINRANWDTFAKTSCDVLINANGNSRKYLANSDPMVDFDANVRTVARMLEDFKASTYVLLSTGDVYADQSTPDLTREDGIIDPGSISRYGLHKKMGEDLVRGVHPNWLILRMGGFVGPGLKKNAIYDMLHDQPVWLSPESELQFINTDTAARLVWDLVEHGVSREVVNLGARGLVNLGDLHKKLGTRSEFKPDAPVIRYELNLDKLDRLVSRPLPDTNQDVTAFISAWPGRNTATC